MAPIVLEWTTSIRAKLNWFISSVILAASLTVPIPSNLALASTEHEIHVQKCKVVRMQPAGLLATCGTHVVALWLNLTTHDRALRFTSDGLFHLNCPIEPMCTNEPQIDGWITRKEQWQQSSKDAVDIFKIIHEAPAISLPGAPAPAEPIGEDAKTVCEAFPIELAGMPGYAACFRAAGANLTVIAAVASGSELGYAILFRQRGADVNAFREKVLDLMSNFRLERSQGDMGLLRWLR